MSNVSRLVRFGHYEYFLAHKPSDGYITMYSCVLSRIFLKLTLLQLIISFLDYIGLSLSQLTLNSFARIMVFDKLCFEMGIKATKVLL